MADKIKAIKIKQENGTYSEEIPISVNVQNVQWDENGHTLLDVLGSIDISSSGKGNLQHQIDKLDGDKISTNEFNSRLNDFLKDQISAETTDWLDDNVNPVGSAVIVDKTLTIDGAAADAKVVGDELTAVKADLGNVNNYLNKETVVTYSRNRIDASTITPGLLQSDGTVVETSNRATSDFIPATSGTTYRNCYWDSSNSSCVNSPVRYSLYYDINKNIIGVGPTTTTGTFECEGLAYIRYSFNADKSDMLMLLLNNTSTSDITDYIGYSETVTSTYGRKYKVIANGDSITFGHKPSVSGYDGMTNGVSYITLACQALGYELENNAISMSTLTLDTDGTDNHQALVARYANMSNDANLVWIAIGSNDWYYENSELGTMDDRTGNTFYGAMHVLCAGLRAKYGAIPIIFCTPIKRWIIRDGSSSIAGNLNFHREPITGICNAIKEVCEYYGMPVVDMYSVSYLNAWTDYDRANFVPDGTHPNLAGHQRMQIECEAVLRKFLPVI